MIGMYARRSITSLAIVCTLAGGTAPLRAEDDIARAKELYLTAEYDEALALLNRLDQTGPATARTEIATYRVFCLLALDKREEARGAIQRIVTIDPFFALPEGEASPRIQTTFRDTRRQLLPSIVTTAYAAAKTAYESKSADATAQFDTVIRLLDDPDAAALPNRSDLRTLAVGFRDLSAASTAAAVEAAARAAASVAPQPAAPAPSAARPGVNNSVGAAPPAAAAASPATGAVSPSGSNGSARASATASSIPASTAAARDVVPPVVISQSLPPWQPLSTMDRTMEFKGSVEVVIDAEGKVTSAKLVQSVHPRYDQVLLAAARAWRYKPATKNGAPVEYVKVVDIKLAK